MLVLLTSTMLVRVDDQDEAAEAAVAMTKATDAALIDTPRDIAFPLGVLVQVVPEDVAN